MMNKILILTLLISRFVFFLVQGQEGCLKPYGNYVKVFRCFNENSTKIEDNESNYNCTNETSYFLRSFAHILQIGLNLDNLDKLDNFQLDSIILQCHLDQTNHKDSLQRNISVEKNKKFVQYYIPSIYIENIALIRISCGLLCPRRKQTIIEMYNESKSIIGSPIEPKMFAEIFLPNNGPPYVLLRVEPTNKEQQIITNWETKTKLEFCSDEYCEAGDRCSNYETFEKFEITEESPIRFDDSRFSIGYWPCTFRLVVESFANNLEILGIEVVEHTKIIKPEKVY